MSQGLVKEFVNVGVQSPSEFQVTSDEASIQSVTHRTTDKTPIKSKVDSNVQTQDSACEFKPLVKKSNKTAIVSTESHILQKKSSENLNGKSIKKVKKKGMDKKPVDALATTRTTSDLEKRKLEAELKATEEIAKIKQSVIEKRLEFELASLQDDCTPNIQSQQKSPQNVLKIFENSREKDENPEEAEQSSPIYRNPLMPATPPAQITRSPFQPPYSNAISPLNQYTKDYSKARSSKNDSDFMIRSEIKPLKLGPISSGISEPKYLRPGTLEKPQQIPVFPEKGKFMQPIEKPKYKYPGQMGPNPFKSVPEDAKFIQMPQMVVENYYGNRAPERNTNLEEGLEEPGCSPGIAKKLSSNSLWKTIMLKMKKKLKKRPPSWQ